MAKFRANTDWLSGTQVDEGGKAAFVQAVTSGGSGATADQVQGNVASGAADAGNPVKVGGVYNTTLPTLTNGQRADLQLGLRGALDVSLYAVDSSTPIGSSGNTSDGGAALRGLAVTSYGAVYNGTTWDRARKPNGISRLTSSAAGGSPTNAKASAGDLFQFWGQNAAAATYLQLYNKASAPVVGTDTPILTYPIPASTVFSQSIDSAYFPLGIGYAFTTDAAGTTGAAAAAVTSFGLLYA